MLLSEHLLKHDWLIAKSMSPAAIGAYFISFQGRCVDDARYKMRDACLPRAAVGHSYVHKMYCMYSVSLYFRPISPADGSVGRNYIETDRICIISLSLVKPHPNSPSLHTLCEYKLLSGLDSYISASSSSPPPFRLNSLSPILPSTPPSSYPLSSNLFCP